MLSFDLTPEQEQLKETARRFAADEIIPVAADMAIDVEAMRLLTYKAAWLLDQGAASSIVSSYAKAFGADQAMRITTDAVQVFGGYSYMKEYPVEKLMRDAKLLQIYEGTSQVQRVVIARNLLK
jgi:acyl-CoA dehydrogenase